MMIAVHTSPGGMGKSRPISHTPYLHQRLEERRLVRGRRACRPTLPVLVLLVAAAVPIPTTLPRATIRHVLQGELRVGLAPQHRHQPPQLHDGARRQLQVRACPRRLLQVAEEAAGVVDAPEPLAGADPADVLGDGGQRARSEEGAGHERGEGEGLRRQDIEEPARQRQAGPERPLLAAEGDQLLGRWLLEDAVAVDLFVFWGFVCVCVVK